MTLLKKPIKEEERTTFETVIGIVIIVIVLACVAIFFPMLILPLLK